MKCPTCATENPDGSRFCMSCATPLASAAPAAPATPVSAAPLPPPPVPPVRHRQPHEDILGLMGLAFFLIAVAVVFAQNASLFADLGNWVHRMSLNNTIFVRPPEGVIVGAAWFFGVLGVLEFVSASLRWALGWTHLRATTRALAGVGDLVFAALLSLYASRTISGTFLLTVLAGVVGVLLLIYITLGIYWASARPAPTPETAQPPAQQ